MLTSTLRLKKEGEEKTTIKLAKEVTFLNKADIMLFLDPILENHHLTIGVSNSLFIHPDIFDVIDDFKEA